MDLLVLRGNVHTGCRSFWGCIWNSCKTYRKIQFFQISDKDQCSFQDRSPWNFEDLLKPFSRSLTHALRKHSLRSVTQTNTDGSVTCSNYNSDIKQFMLSAPDAWARPREGTLFLTAVAPLVRDCVSSSLDQAQLMYEVHVSLSHHYQQDGAVFDLSTPHQHGSFQPVRARLLKVDSQVLM